jgi:uncharacterized membrane protein HdeD (DUF308 family)
MMTSQSDGTPGWLSWRTCFILGLITVVLGVIVVFRPTQSLTAIAVLLGIAMIASGVYHVARAVDGREHERVWRGISGVLFILAGLALIRHLHLSVALIGLFIGFTWIVQGVAGLIEAVSGRRPGATGWPLFFGVISLIAGIVVVSAPISSVTALAIFAGIWLIVIGLVEMLGALVTRHVPGSTAEAASPAAARPPAGRPR